MRRCKIAKRLPQQFINLQTLVFLSGGFFAFFCVFAKPENNFFAKLVNYFFPIFLWVVYSSVARWFLFKPKKNPKLCKLWRVLQWKMLVYFMSIWHILQPFGTFSPDLVHFFLSWYVVPRKIWQPCFIHPSSGTD
jgi:hypothetical protein